MREPASVVRRARPMLKARKFGSFGLVAAAAAAQVVPVCAIVWMPATAGLKSALSQNCWRAPAGMNGLLIGIVTVWLKMPDGATIVLTRFLEKMPRA